MKTFWYIIYNLIFIPLFFAVLKIASFFNMKIKKGIEGREKIFENLIIELLKLDRTKKLLWFHSSSLGEFEQAKPIIEEIKKNRDVNILVTFYSPSGYENSKNYQYADLVTYIPFDTNFNATRFLKFTRPDLAILMRYDIWPNHIWAMKKLKVTNFLVDATLAPNSPRKFFLIKNFHKHLFNDISEILTVSDKDKNEFLKFALGERKVKVVGDTRFDRVYQKSLTAKQKGLINQNLLQDKKVLVAGSTWEQDEEVLFPALMRLNKDRNDILIIIAPHEPNQKHVEKIENELGKELETIRFSNLKNYSNEKIIIVDSIGILLTLYSYADIAFVGGSFKQNVHNVLEAAVYGIPVLYGPKINKSIEAKELLKLKGGILIENKNDAYEKMKALLRNEDNKKEKGEISFNFVQNNLGATKKILEEIYKII
jgi:3-deoxy-D-manno-octulosonic-acid transferase